MGEGNFKLIPTCLQETYFLELVMICHLVFCVSY